MMEIQVSRAVEGGCSLFQSWTCSNVCQCHASLQEQTFIVTGLHVATFIITQVMVMHVQQAAWSILKVDQVGHWLHYFSPKCFLLPSWLSSLVLLQLVSGVNILSYEVAGVVKVSTELVMCFPQLVSTGPLSLISCTN